VLEADTPVRQEPTFNPDAFDPSAELADKYKQALNTTATSQPKAKLVPDGKGFAIVAPNGQRFPGFANQKEATDWIAKPENYKMVMGIRDLNLKPLGSFDKFKQTGSFPRAKKAGKWSSILAVGGVGANYAYNKFRDQDLSDYSPEDQEYIKQQLPKIKDWYNNVEKFKTDLDRDQQLQVVDYVNTLKKLPALKADFPPNSKWDIYVKTIN
jgi:hypothetical protein